MISSVVVEMTETGQGSCGELERFRMQKSRSAFAVTRETIVETRGFLWLLESKKNMTTVYLYTYAIAMLYDEETKPIFRCYSG